MALELSTAGITLKWAVETTAGTRPTTGFSTLRGVKSISSFNPEPNMLDVTPLSETGYKHYIPGLKDVGGSQSITVNDYDDFRTDWTSLMTAYTTAKAAGKALWVEYCVPGITTNGSFYYTAIPVDLGFNGAEVDGVYENVAYLIPNTVEGWAAHSTATVNPL